MSVPDSESDPGKPNMPGLVMRVCSLPLETGKASSGFGAKPEKQFLFWDLRPKKAIGSGCNPGGTSCRMRLGMSNRL